MSLIVPRCRYKKFSTAKQIANKTDEELKAVLGAARKKSDSDSEDKKEKKSKKRKRENEWEVELNWTLFSQVLLKKSESSNWYAIVQLVPLVVESSNYNSLVSLPAIGSASQLSWTELSQGISVEPQSESTSWYFRIIWQWYWKLDYTWVSVTSLHLIN